MAFKDDLIKERQEKLIAFDKNDELKCKLSKVTRKCEQLEWEVTVHDEQVMKLKDDLSRSRQMCDEVCDEVINLRKRVEEQQKQLDEHKSDDTVAKKTVSWDDGWKSERDNHDRINSPTGDKPVEPGLDEPDLNAPTNLMELELDASDLHVRFDEMKYGLSKLFSQIDRVLNPNQINKRGVKFGSPEEALASLENKLNQLVAEMKSGSPRIHIGDKVGINTEQAQLTEANKKLALKLEKLRKKFECGKRDKKKLQSEMTSLKSKVEKADVDKSMLNAQLKTLTHSRDETERQLQEQKAKYDELWMNQASRRPSIISTTSDSSTSTDPHSRTPSLPALETKSPTILNTDHNLPEYSTHHRNLHEAIQCLTLSEALAVKQRRTKSDANISTANGNNKNNTQEKMATTVSISFDVCTLKCQRCDKAYSQQKNPFRECKYHTGHYIASLISGKPAKWQCCGKMNREDPGCNASQHVPCPKK